MKTLHICVSEKQATYQKRDGDIVCGNSNYLIEFAFDREWDPYEEKTARFIYNSEYTDVDFEGNTCNVPILRNTDQVEIGVYAGDLRTTTRAVILCKPSILCGTATPSEENDQHYANEAKEAADRAEAAASILEGAVEYIAQVDKLLGGES